MSEVNFKSLQNTHESLLQKQQKLTEETQGDFASEVKTYIDQAKQAGSNIASTRERDQVRANLRYWANYIYSIEKSFPDTELAPSTVSEKRPVGNTIAFILFVILVLFGAIQAIRSAFGPPIVATEIPVSDETETPLPPATEPPVITPTDALPTLVFVGSDVAFTSPKNGDNVLPKTVFKGAYTNFKSESSIHVLLIRGDKLYPLQDFFAVPTESVNGEWNIGEETGGVALYQNPDELQQPENLIVVPAACFDQSCREKLANAVQTGLSAEELPSQLSFTLYRDSSRVLFRNAYDAVQEVRLIFPLYDGNSYDLYTSKPDGSDLVRITQTPDVSELWPQLSSDGKHIVFVKYFLQTETYAIAIMDSNGQNDYEIIDGGKNNLENPQWSPDSVYILYVMGDTSRSAVTTYWSIHAYNLLTKDSLDISGEAEALANRSPSWLPDKNIIVFDARFGGKSRFIQAPVDSPGSHSLFFDSKQVVLQPDISVFGNGYLLLYTVQNDDSVFSHDIYAVIDSDGQAPFDGSPFKLVDTGGGSADHPILDPDSNVVLYIENGIILRVGFNVDGNEIILDRRANTTDIEIDTGRPVNLSFDIGFMEAFFPIP